MSDRHRHAGVEDPAVLGGRGHRRSRRRIYVTLISGRSPAEIEKRAPSLDGLDEPTEEENDGQHDQLTWFLPRVRRGLDSQPG